jgi:preprotein translocase subunit SecE
LPVPKEMLVAKTKKSGKTQKSGKAQRSDKKPNAVRRYINETVGELRKVTWPTRKEATNLTIIVLIVTFVMSAYLGLLDYIFTQLFALLLG